MDNAKDHTKEDTILNKINNNAYNDIVLSQDDTMCSHIFEYLVPSDLPNRSTLCPWDMLNKKYHPIKVSSKTILHKK